MGLVLPEQFAFRVPPCKIEGFGRRSSEFRRRASDSGRDSQTSERSRSEGRIVLRCPQSAHLAGGRKASGGGHRKPRTPPLLAGALAARRTRPLLPHGRTAPSEVCESGFLLSASDTIHQRGRLHALICPWRGQRPLSAPEVPRSPWSDVSPHQLSQDHGVSRSVSRPGLGYPVPPLRPRTLFRLRRVD